MSGCDGLKGSCKLIVRPKGCRCVGGGGHGGPRPAQDLQEVSEDAAEAQGTEKTVGPPAEHPPHRPHHRRRGLRRGGHHVVSAVGLCV